jgi:hypothetical protein
LHKDTNCSFASCVAIFGTGVPNPPAGLTLGGSFYRPSGTTTGECQQIDSYAKVFFKNTQCQRITVGISTVSAFACCKNGTLVWNQYGSSDCTTNLQSSQTIDAGGCVPFSGGGFAQNSCPAGGLDTCPSFVSATTTISTTTPPAGSSNSCFHVDTRITYKGAIYTLADLRDFHECSIPHTVTTTGLRIETALHVLRVTPDHLIFSRDRLVASSTLKMGDMIDTIEGPKSITRITIDTDQSYFGLNCLDSIVHANGIRTSTFGSYHAIPAAWMSIIGRLAGIQRASRWGDFFASVWHRI